jgi:hypothetical protein
VSGTAYDPPRRGGTHRIRGDAVDTDETAAHTSNAAALAATVLD